MLEEHHIKVEKTARYFTLGRLSENTKSIWLVFHGYGQLAKEFVQNFTVLENDSTFIVVPEATNKFYLRGFTGKIGATWMTKEDRENEIDDYVEMINRIFNAITREINLSNIKINILGFSQGTHTCIRWLDKHQPKIDNLIIWAGGFPRNCNYEINSEFWSNIKIKLVVGEYDRFLTQEMIDAEKYFLKSHNFIYNFYNFNGDHEIDKKTLIELSLKI